LKKIIEYAITDPGPESESNPLRAYKYPFVASELLSLTNGPLLNLYFLAEVEEETEESVGKAVEKLKKDLVVKADETKGLVQVEAIKQDLVETENDEDWIDDEQESTHKPMKKIKKKKAKKYSKPRRRLRILPHKKAKKPQPMLEKKERMKEDKKEQADIVVTEDNHTTEQNTKEPNEEKKISETGLENNHSMEDLDIAINDNATIVSDESGNNNYGTYELVYMLFAFVDVEPDIELNELLAGYFKGAALALLNGKPKEMAEFLESNYHIVYNLVLHSNNKSIAEVLCKVVSIDDEYFVNPTQFNEVRRNVLNKILTLIEDPVKDVYSIRQFAQTFCDLNEQSKDVSLFCCSMEFLRRIVGISLNDDSAVASAGVTILTRLVSKDKSQLRLFLQEQLSNLPGCTDPQTEEISKLIKDLLVNFKVELTKTEENQMNQLGIEVRSFGSYRLKIVECVHTLINLNILPIIDLMYQLLYPKLLCDLFVVFPFNSVLHSLIYSMFKSVFDSESKTLLHIVLFATYP
jgi:hypothetical protein